MNQNEELSQISKSLLRYIIRKKHEGSNKNKYVFFNEWCREENIKIMYQENVNWCFSFIENIQKTNIKNYDILCKFFA